MEELIYQCKKGDGKFSITGRKILDKQIENLPDGNYTLQLKKVRKRRSNPQNRYYFGCMIKMIMEGLKEMGARVKLSEHDSWMGDLVQALTPEATHNYLKNNFIDIIKVDEETGEITKNELSTKKMSTTEFIEYMAPIYEWASEFLKINIPLPDPNWNVDYSNER